MPDHKTEDYYLVGDNTLDVKYSCSVRSLIHQIDKFENDEKIKT